MAQPRSDYARLKDEFVGDYFRLKGASRDGFVGFCRKVRKPRLSINEKEWPAFLGGKPVLADLVEAFTEYATEHERIGRYTFHQIAEYTEPPPPPVSPGTNIWQGGFAALFGRRARDFGVPQLAFARTTADVDQAARIVVAGVGRRHAAHPLTDEEAVRDGERIMARSVADHARLLQSWWEKVPRSLMFAVSRKRQPHRRTGVAVCVPVTRAFYDRMAGGEAGDMDLTPDDLEYPSPCVHVNAAAEVNAPTRGQRFSFGAAVLHTGMYQLAMIMPELWRHECSPRIVSFGGTPANERRISETGYADTGKTLPGTTKRVYTLSADGGISRNLQYWSLYGLIRLYQSALVEERLLVDTPQ